MKKVLLGIVMVAGLAACDTNTTANTQLGVLATAVGVGAVLVGM